MAINIKARIDGEQASRHLKGLVKDLDKVGDAAQESSADSVRAMDQMTDKLATAEQEANDAARAVDGIADPQTIANVQQLEKSLHAAGNAAEEVAVDAASAGKSLDGMAGQTKLVGETTQRASDVTFDFVKNLSGSGGLIGALESIVPKLSAMAGSLSGPWGAALTFGVAILGSLVASMLESADAADKETDALKSQRDIVAELNDAIARQLGLKNQLNDLNNPDDSAKAVEAKRREVELLNEQAEAQRQLMIDQRNSAEGDRVQAGRMSGDSEAEERWLNQAKESGAASQKAHQEWLRLHSEAVTASKELEKLQERNLDLIDDAAQKKRTEDAQKFLEDQKQAWATIVEAARKGGDQFFDHLEKRRQEFDKNQKKVEEKTQKADDTKREKGEKEAAEKKAADDLEKTERDKKAVGGPEGVLQAMQQQNPKQVRDELEANRLEKLGLDDASISKKVQESGAGDGTLSDMLETRNSLERDARDARSQVRREAQTGKVDPSEMAQAQADVLTANLKSAQAAGKVTVDVVNATVKMAQELAANAKELEAVHTRMTNFQNQLNALLQQGERRRSQMGGGR